MAENEFFRISEVSRQKEITNKASKSSVESQIVKPNRFALVINKIAIARGIKIKKAAMKKPSK